jgi:DNA-directed RNA polymerase subunit K/omega
MNTNQSNRQTPDVPADEIIKLVSMYTTKLEKVRAVAVRDTTAPAGAYNIVDAVNISINFICQAIGEICAILTNPESKEALSDREREGHLLAVNKAWRFLLSLDLDDLVLLPAYCGQKERPAQLLFKYLVTPPLAVVAL